MRIKFAIRPQCSDESPAKVVLLKRGIKLGPEMGKRFGKNDLSTPDPGHFIYGIEIADQNQATYRALMELDETCGGKISDLLKDIIAEAFDRGGDAMDGGRNQE